MAGMVPFECPNCGAKVQVDSSRPTFSCKYCGSQHSVQVKGDTVNLGAYREAAAAQEALRESQRALEAQRESLAEQRESLERNSAELAIRRLEDDLEDLKAERARVQRKRPSCCCGGCLLVPTLLMGIALIGAASENDEEAAGVIAIILGVLLFALLGAVLAYWSKSGKVKGELAGIKEEIRATQAELARNEEILDQL